MKKVALLNKTDILKRLNYTQRKGLFMKKVLTSALILATTIGCGRHNGHDGKDGQDGTDGTTTVIHEYLPAPEVGEYILNGIDPICGVMTTGAEVILTYKNTKTNEIFLLVSFSNNTSGDYTRLSVLSIGTYRTTDQFTCNFKVELNAQNQLSWKKI